ncbi:MAG: phage antirepressor [Dysgonomonas sp.]
MSNVGVFNFNSKQFRTFNNNGEVFFCLADVCSVLELQTNKVKERLNEDGWNTIPCTDSLGRVKDMTFINEPNFYKTVLQSRKPQAEPFTDYVTKEVLPSIRKHGAYMTPETIEKTLLSPDFIIKLATNLKEEQLKRIEAEKQVLKLKPKAELMDKVLDSGEKIDIGQAAKILNLPYGRNRLFKKLRELGVLFKGRNEPKQEYIDKKFFELKEKWVDRNEHDGFAVIKILVTQKGLEFLNGLLSGDKTTPNMAKIA